MLHAQPSVADLQLSLARQRAAFHTQPYPSLAQRRAALKRLRAAIRKHASALAQAAQADFGSRATAETLMLDVAPSVLHVDHLLRRLGRLMKPSRRGVEWLFLTNRAWVAYQPKGVVGIMAPWNFPIYLVLGPLATALAAGNRCMIKTSEHAPQTSQALKQMLATCFDRDEVAVVEGGPAVAAAFSRLPFDHIVFTGSPEIGRHVMRAAADNLTPVTLELGGKSPALVSATADLRVAARRVAHGKTTNAGQVCVAPDYALVPRASAEVFAQMTVAAADRLCGDDDNCSLIHDGAYARQQALIEDARDKGATVLVAPGGAGRRMPLHVVLGVTDDMRLAREEIFGPILPVFTYDRFEEAVERINIGTRPLALYYFGHDPAERETVLKRTHSGGVTFNDWGWHVVNHDLPFGGVGTSGMGNYHGDEGFRELSHAKAVYDQHRLFPIELFHPPYGGLLQRLALFVMTGRAG
ncbi:coniferyl aldehyde dehydrogenase [Caulobacter sp. 17J80-11]|uniref:coniferyl aldehyde dehydrogenase n=1 Tax=Caulobacter sp. 17J80-11 TaxID=2763502 RepID=UPI0016536768|nr:coniferyl aldehyde dehydrogenase [Caulobacter sp. 17J80-11]MBC6980361.1 coniferyl aldehyde dehydrogenase [Caulobacter sp. 17J80-11]